MAIVEQILDVERPARKIYYYIAIGASLGGPLVAGYLIAQNFKAFNEPHKAKITWVYTIAATILIYGTIFLLNYFKIHAEILIAFIFTGIAYMLGEKFQGRDISAHIASGGKLYSLWRVIPVSLIGLAVTFAAVIILVVVFAVLYLISSIIYKRYF